MEGKRMLKTSLRLLLAVLCLAGLAVTPALAGGGAATPGSVGGAANETATNWFVELASPPAVKGTSETKLKAEHDAFKVGAAADGVKLTERYSYDSLWNGVSVAVAPSQVSTLESIPGVKAVYPVHTVSLPDWTSESGGSAAEIKKTGRGSGAAHPPEQAVARRPRRCDPPTCRLLPRTPSRRRRRGRRHPP